MSVTDQRQILTTREWIDNDTRTLSFVSTHVEYDEWHNEKRQESGWNVDASLTLGDCGRSITWNFDASKFEDFEDAFQKLARIEQHFASFRAALEEAQRLAVAHHERATAGVAVNG